MKHLRNYFYSLIFILTLSAAMPISVFAFSTDTNVSREYYSDGSYTETKIDFDQRYARSTITSASKTKTYYSSSGEAKWSITVTARFSYNGSTSSCSSASVSASIHDDNFVVSNKKVSKSGNSATASASASQYDSSGKKLSTSSLSVTISCDKNGNIK